MERPLLSENGFSHWEALTFALDWPQWLHSKLTDNRTADLDDGLCCKCFEKSAYNSHQYKEQWI